MQTHLPILIVFFFVFALSAFTLELRNVLHYNRLTIMFICRVLYIFSLAVLPALIFWGYLLGVRGSSIRFEDKLIWTFYVQLILTVVGYLAMNFGYCIKQRHIPPKPQTIGRRITATAVTFMIISAVSLVLWASAYGGVAVLLEDAEWIRASVVEAQNSFTFFKHFVPISMLASYMLFYLLLTKTARGIIKRVFVAALLVASVWLSFVYLQANDGRLLLAVYVLLFFFLYFRYQCEQQQIPLRKILPRALPVLLIGIAILFNAEELLNWMRGTRQDEVIERNESFFTTITREFSFIVASTQRSILEVFSGEGKLMIVNDAVNGLFAWLPYSLKPVRLMDVWAYNTHLVAPDITSTSPTTMVAQSVYDLGIVGILVMPALFGMFTKKMEQTLDSYGNNIFIYSAYAALVYPLCKMTAYFSIYNFMINAFYIFPAILIYWLLQRIKYK